MTMGKTQMITPSTYQLVNSGAEFFEIQLDIIQNAKKEIHFQTYILMPDDTGMETINALKEAVKRGVTIYMMLDAFGSNSLDKDFEKDITAAGIQFRFFSPLFSMKGLHLGRRMHHKILVADNQTALIGGINTSDHYHGTEKEKAWLDFAVKMEGPVCEEAVELCVKLFERQLSPRKIFRKKLRSNLAPKNSNIRLLHNDYLRRKTQIYSAYIREVNHAKDHIILIASYFSPGRRFRNALVKAAKRGVKIKLILAGTSDVPFMKYSTTFLYDLLFRHNVVICEWCDSILHAKAMVVDGKWCTIGSFNMINLSAYGSIETNVEIKDEKYAKAFEKRLEEVCRTCEVIKPEDYKKSKYWLGQFRNWLAYHFMRRVFYFMTFFSYKRLFINYIKE